MSDLLRRLVAVTSVIVSVPVCMAIGNQLCDSPGNVRAVSGTYQVIGDAVPLDNREMDSLRLVIEAKREEDKVVIFSIAPTTQVKVLPRTEILSPKFRPVEEFVFTNSKVKRLEAGQ
jgi:hypothetical protein